MNWIWFAIAAALILVLTGAVIFVMYQTTQPQLYLWFKTGQNPLTVTAARNQALQLGGIIATPQQVEAAQQDGAAWCDAGWASDGNTYFPEQSTHSGCGTKGVNQGNCARDFQNNCGVLVFGKKPPAGSANITPWSGTQWSAWVWDKPFH